MEKLLTLEEMQNLARIRDARRDGRRGPRLTTAQRRQILLDYIAGETPSALAGKYGVSQQTVYYHMNRHAAEADRGKE
jgi:DNA invertase Pin-like site-specific DNA recombinase